MLVVRWVVDTWYGSRGWMWYDRWLIRGTALTDGCGTIGC